MANCPTAKNPRTDYYVKYRRYREYIFGSVFRVILINLAGFILKYDHICSVFRFPSECLNWIINEFALASHSGILHWKYTVHFFTLNSLFRI